MNFSSQIFFKDFDKSYSTDISKKNSLWLLPFFMAVATLCYYKKVSRTMSTAIVLHLLKPTKVALVQIFSTCHANLRALRANDVYFS